MHAFRQAPLSPRSAARPLSSFGRRGAARLVWWGRPMRAMFAAVLVGAAVAFFALGALTSHYRTAPWPWLYSMVRDSKAGLQRVRKKPDDHKHRAGGAKKIVVKVIPSGLLNFDFVIHNVNQPIIGKGGGLAVTDGGVLIAHSLTGELYFFDEATQKLELIRLRLPDNNFAKLPERDPRGAHDQADSAAIQRSGVHPERRCPFPSCLLHAIPSGQGLFHQPARHTRPRGGLERARGGQ